VEGIKSIKPLFRSKEIIIPYITYDRKLDLATSKCATSPGELNYLITRVLIDHWNRGQQNYQVINDIIGALEGAKLEFYRRIVVPYEEQKIDTNGDVYEE
jgi:hypothetical protein